jgi:hypothetical protein
MSHENFNTLNNHEEIFEMINKEFLQLYFFQGDVFEVNNQIRNFFDLKDGLEQLRSIHFILSPQVLSLLKSLPLLLRNLPHSTYRKNELMKGRVQGSINWNNTIKTRLSSGYNDKTLFVCSLPNKFYNLEENQLLKFLLNKIIHLKEYYLPFAKPSKYEFDFEKLDEDDDWYTKVKDRYEVCKKTLKKVYFDDIDDIEKVSYKHLKKIYNHKNSLYSKIVFDVYKLYYNLFINYDETVLNNFIKQTIIKSRDSNKLYELYVVSEIDRALPGESEYNLFYDNGKGNIIKKKLNDEIWATIYYQWTPDDLKRISKYKKLCRGYSIGYNVRSPDVIVKFEHENTYRLFEVKNTNNKHYVRESIYKVMGYMNDFEGDENESYLTEKYPIILVTFGGIHQKNNEYKNEKIVICNKDEFIKYLDEGIFFKCYE